MMIASGRAADRNTLNVPSGRPRVGQAGSSDGAPGASAREVAGARALMSVRKSLTAIGWSR